MVRVYNNSANGDRYEGMFENGKSMVRVYNNQQDGARYEGMFENGKRTWLGCIILQQMEINKRVCLRMTRRHG